MRLRNVCMTVCMYGGVVALTAGLLSACGSDHYTSVDPNPQIRGLTDQTLSQDTATAPLSFTVSDADSGAASLMLVAESSDTNLIPASGITLGGSGANRTIQITPAADAYGEANLTVRAIDPSNRSTMSSFKVRVNGVFVAFSNSTFAAFAVDESGVEKSVNGMTFTGDVDDDPAAFDSLLL